VADLKSEFIEKISKFAILDSKATGVPASLTIAQAALESSWGCSGLTKKANNLFGIKGKGPAGSVIMKTTEYVNGKAIQVDAAFRAYNDWGESIADHSKLIVEGVSWNKKLYHGCLNVDGKTAAKEIAKAGYATDPNYAEKLIQIMDTYDLCQYDKTDCIKVVVNDVLVGYGRVIEGHVYLPLRQLGEALGKTVDWDNDKKIPYVDGKVVDAFKIIDNTTYVGVRAAAEMLGAQVSWSGTVKKVFIYK
jgi:hypothetical protein